MKIYTKTGDAGETGLANGERQAKNRRRIAAVGVLDEYSAAVGVLLAVEAEHQAEDLALLQHSQGNALFIGAVVAGANESVLTSQHRFDIHDVTALEQRIDQLEAQLPALREFILPGGVMAAAVAHQARTVCRRAERQLVAVQNEIDSAYWPAVLAYINRLSDYLFVLARSYNLRAKVNDIPWRQA